MYKYIHNPLDFQKKYPVEWMCYVKLLIVKLLLVKYFKKKVLLYLMFCDFYCTYYTFKFLKMQIYISK